MFFKNRTYNDDDDNDEIICLTLTWKNIIKNLTLLNEMIRDRRISIRIIWEHWILRLKVKVTKCYKTRNNYIRKWCDVMLWWEWWWWRDSFIINNLDNKERAKILRNAPTTIVFMYESYRMSYRVITILVSRNVPMFMTNKNKQT